MDFNWKREQPKIVQEQQTDVQVRTGGRQEVPVSTKGGGGDFLVTLLCGAGVVGLVITYVAISNGNKRIDREYERPSASYNQERRSNNDNDISLGFFNLLDGK